MAYSEGVGKIADNGCVCHGAQEDNVVITLEGLPEEYSAGESYNVTITLSSSVEANDVQGGFRIIPSHGNFSGEGWIEAESGWTHSDSINDRRSWTGVWTAPIESDKLATFVLHGNTVNGDAQANDDDDWNSYSVAVPGPDYTGDTSAPDVDLSLGAVEIVVGILAIALLGWLTFLAMRD